MLITNFRNRGDAEQDHRGRGRHGEVGEAGGRGQRQVDRQQEKGLQQQSNQIWRK